MFSTVFNFQDKSSVHQVHVKVDPDQRAPLKTKVQLESGTALVLLNSKPDDIKESTQCSAAHLFCHWS